jgi:hypothetical protein
MTTTDFKARIALIMRNAEQTGKQWTLVGGPRSHQCVLRKPSDRGYNKPNKKGNK